MNHEASQAGSGVSSSEETLEGENESVNSVECPPGQQDVTEGRVGSAGGLALSQFG